MSSTNDVMLLLDDQLASQFNIIFPDGIPGGGDTNRISMRMDQAFDPPEDTVNVYEIFMRGINIPKTSMLHEMDKTFQVPVRLDNQWQVFDDLNTWKNMCYNPINGTALPDLNTRTTVLIEALDGQQAVMKTIRFRGVKIKGMKIDQFDNASGDPLRVQLTCIFNDMIYE